MSEPILTIEFANRIATLTLNRQDWRNAVNDAPMAEIEDMSKADGLFTECLCAALVRTAPDAKEGLAAFLEKRTPVFR